MIELIVRDIEETQVFDPRLPDLESFLARLLMLREAGYRFPQSVIDDVRQELAEPVAPAEKRDE